jgi:hypothetical protein
MKQKKDTWILFARNVTLQDVVPESNSLCPPYMDNIFSTCYASLPLVDTMVGDVKIIKGFIPRAKFFANKSDRHLTKYEYALSEGNGIVFTFGNWDDDTAYEVARAVFNRNRGENIHIVIEENAIAFYRGMNSRMVLKQIPGIDKLKTLLSD